MKCNFFYEDFSLKFDKNKNPILNSEESKRDYEILKNIFLNPIIMKTSTAFCGQIPSSDRDFHILIFSLLNRENSFDVRYGFRKIFNNYKEFIGLGGLIQKKELLDKKNVFEIAYFVDEKFHNKGYGIWYSMHLLDTFDWNTGMIIASVWDKFTQNNKFLLKNGFKFISKTSKAYQDKSLSVNIYLKNSLNQEYHFNDLQNVDKFLITSVL